MRDDRPALPEAPETYTDFDAPLKSSRIDGDHLVRLAESVNDTVETFYQKAKDKRELDNKGISDGEVDKEVVYLATQYVPEAVENLGDAIGEARDIEEALEGKNGIGIEHLDPEEEEEFLESYREAEGLYREVFQQLGRYIEGQPVTEFVDDRYHVNPEDSISEVPDPRPDFR